MNYYGSTQINKYLKYLWVFSLLYKLKRLIEYKSEQAFNLFF